MVAQLKDALETVKDAVLPSPTYRTTKKKFKNDDLFLKALVPGDQVMAKDEIAQMPGLGINSRSTHEIERVDGKCLVLKGGKRILAEWFLPEVSRRERVRHKVARPVLMSIACDFAKRRWADFRDRLDIEIKSAEEQVVKAQTEVERAQNRLKQVQEAVVKLQQAKVDDKSWPVQLTGKLLSLIDQKLFTNFEQLKEADYDVFVLYTGPMWALTRIGDPASKIRGEYALKIYPTKAKTRIVVENVASGKLPGDVPFNENRIGVCNICFGELTTQMETLVRDEDWVRALIMVRAFLEGNRSN